jgi:hypothetical protein
MSWMCSRSHNRAGRLSCFCGCNPASSIRRLLVLLISRIDFLLVQLLHSWLEPCRKPGTLQKVVSLGSCGRMAGLQCLGSFPHTPHRFVCPEHMPPQLIICSNKQRSLVYHFGHSQIQQNFHITESLLVSIKNGHPNFLTFARRQR